MDAAASGPSAAPDGEPRLVTRAGDAARLDRRLVDRLLPAPSVLLAIVGMTGMAVTGSVSAVIGGALVFGAGFGVLQNASLVLMYARAPAGSESVVSAIWNVAYDLGMAGGACCAGPMIMLVGYSATFVVIAAVMVPALVVVRRDRPTWRGRQRAMHRA